MDVGQNEAVQRTCPNSQRVAASQSTTATELGVPDAPHAKPGLAVLCPLCPGLLGIRETQPLHRHREVTDHLALGIGERDQELIDPDRVGSPGAVLVGEGRMVRADDRQRPDVLVVAAGDAGQIDAGK
jgi:hypothetical protein